MAIHFGYSPQHGVCVYEGGVLKYRAETLEQIKELQFALIWGVPVTLGGALVDCPRLRAALAVAAAQAVVDRL